MPSQEAALPAHMCRSQEYGLVQMLMQPCSFSTCGPCAGVNLGPEHWRGPCVSRPVLILFLSPQVQVNLLDLAAGIPATQSQKLNGEGGLLPA